MYLGHPTNQGSRIASNLNTTSVGGLYLGLCICDLIHVIECTVFILHNFLDLDRP